MRELVVGANEGLAETKILLSLDCEKAEVLGRYAALALLPVNEKRSPVAEPALFRITQPWMQWCDDVEPCRCHLDLAALPGTCDRVLLVVYTFAAAGPVCELQRLRLQVGDGIRYELDLGANGEAAIIMGECYRRGQQWKFRALAEGSAYGLAAFGRRLGLTISDAHPDARHPADGYGGRGGHHGGGSSGATGTGFAVSPRHILTCAHVIEDMQDIHIASFEGRHRAEPVMVDRRNDMALLRIEGDPGLQPVTFSEGARCHLGESVVALGFPLAGFAGGDIHVTQGGVSALFGVHNDASILQFTAPIQPGSSGSPLFDSRGAVVGMVTSTITDAQNMNFAVKAELLRAFLYACRIEVAVTPASRTFSTSEMAREAQSSLWRVEARSA
jgi:hypothetical protein